MFLVFHEDGRLFPTKTLHDQGLLSRHLGFLGIQASGQGESYDACAIREVGEELGWIRIGLLRNFSNSQPAWKPVGNSSGFTASLTMALFVHPEEIESGDWFETDEVNRWLDKHPSLPAPSAWCGKRPLHGWRNIILTLATRAHETHHSGMGSGNTGQAHPHG